MQVYERKRKRNRSLNFVAGDKVEVRREDEGLKGSWHSATIVESADSTIRVRYDHLLIDDGDSVIDGSVDEFNTFKHYRGTVRPMPVDSDIGNGLELGYGLCVDVYFSDAWWEGVILDHKDGCQERLVFFPDSSSQQKISSEIRVRISQDWNEASGCWSPRGKWLFLEVIEEKKEILPVGVSEKQIWFHVTGRKDFGKTIVDWTCRSRLLWNGLVTEVICEMYPTTKNDCDVSELQNGVRFSSEKIHGLEDILMNGEELCGNAAPDHAENSDLEHNLNSSYKSVDCDLAKKSSTTSSNSVSSELPNSIADTTNECKNVDDQNYNKTHGNHSTPTEHATWLPAIGTEMLPSAEYCPDALQTYLQTSRFNKNSKQNNDNGTLASVMKHLSCMGWRVEFKQHKVETKSTTVFRYIAPDGVTVYSPLQACQHYFEVIRKLMNKSPGTRQHSSGVVPDRLNHDEQGAQEVIYDPCGNPPVFDICDSETRKYSLGVVSDKLDHKEHRVQEVIYDSCGNSPVLETRNSEVENVRGDSSLRVQATDSYVPERESRPKKREVRLEPEYCPQAVIDWIEVGSHGRNQTMSERAQKHLIAIEWYLWYFTKKGGKQELRYTSPGGKTYISLRTACIACVEEKLLYGKTNGVNGGINSNFTKKKEHFQIGGGQVSEAKRCDEMQTPCKTHLMRPPKRGRHNVEPSPVEYTPKTVLSCLIDNNVILIGKKVSYMGVDDRSKMVKGLICREGIKCGCCNNVFSLTKFEAHAGSVYHRSAANIILEDGRSLLQCQMKLAEAIKLKYFSAESRKRIKRKQPCEKNDSTCSVCCYGGELVLCDQCPSAFHFSCLGLDIKNLPKGHWFCPCCRCGICNQSEFDGDFQQFTEKAALCCDQCEQEYHFGCISQKRLVKIENFPQGNWFCSEKCEQIFMDLHKLLGKPITKGNGSLTWTMLKFSNDDYLDEATIEHHCKLNVALSVMHECFEPIKETRTKKDIIEDVIFNKRSDLNRLNFSGFYTILLEMDDEVISVATVRIYGTNVAEIPLVGTRFQYRGRGMCHILIDVLEKKLAELGVERLVLPAIPQTLHTWTTTFGFSKMTSTERLQFLRYAFLDFQDTIMCQKILRKAPEPFQLTGCCNQLGDEIELKDKVSDLFSEELPVEMTFQV